MTTFEDTYRTNMMIELDPDRIHLWFTFFDEIRNDDLLNRYRNLLPEEEQHWEQRIHSATNRHRYLITRALVRTVLSRYAPVAPEQWSFSKNVYGKPYISNSDALASRISFNVSHTKGLIVLGVTCGGAIGVDTENVRDRHRALDSASAFFSSEETDALEMLPPHTRQERLFQYWTLKESYIKARGMGLAIPLNQFSFHFLELDRLRLAIHMPLKDNPSRWHFWQLRPSEKHLTAVCAERCGNDCKQLVSKLIVPLGAEQSLNCVPILESE
jgi:4'-phosphopantetheinyl transferase